jgi:hypothetical protein
VGCEACGSPAQRRWSPVGLVGRASQPAAEPQAAAPAPLCQANRDIPGLCALSPTAARSLVARLRGDNRALEREIAYQERMQKEAPGTLTVGGHGPTAPGAPHDAGHHHVTPPLANSTTGGTP